MPKETTTAAEKPRRRVSVARKQAQPEVSFDTRVAIEQAIEALDLEAIRKILVSQEAQLNALRIIVFDLQSILRLEAQRRSLPVTKTRIANLISEVRKTIEANAPDLARAHPNREEINDGIQPMTDQMVESIIEETFGPLDDWGNLVDPGQEGIDEATDEMDEVLERAVADHEDAEQAVSRRRRRSHAGRGT